MVFWEVSYTKKLFDLFYIHTTYKGKTFLKYSASFYKPSQLSNEIIYMYDVCGQRRILSTVMYGRI